MVDDSSDTGYVDKGHDDNHAIAKLGLFVWCLLCGNEIHGDVGEWLRDQQTMEDTITILQQEGWMV